MLFLLERDDLLTARDTLKETLKRKRNKPQLPDAKALMSKEDVS
jgi:hypothetical protein